MDRQRNDRLGRKDEHYLAKHRRQILRRCTESDTHAEVSSHAAPAPDAGTASMTSHAILYRFGRFHR
jgi:hypothetical protein